MDDARAAALRHARDDHAPDAFVAALRALAAERPDGDAVAEIVAKHLPRYQRSMAAYARDLAE